MNNIGAKMDVIKTAEAHGYSREDCIWRSRRQSISIPEEETVDTVEMYHRMVQDNDQLAMVDVVSEEKLTYKEFKIKFHTVASGLHELGVRKGDVVLILSPNSLWFPVIIFGCWLLGVTVTTVNPVNTPYEIEKQLKDSCARLIFTVPEQYTKVKKLGKPVVLIAGTEQQQNVPKNTTPFSKLLSADPRRVPEVIRRQSDTAALLYSSGTTGMSKGVVLTHRNIMAVILQLLYDAPPEVRERRYMVMGWPW
ncbi:hypothetical protein Mapa_009140 [Marchantia paleacea]|nr:hypothetical protein Mapa_009140 [Marchantia paleacea]